MANVKFVSGKLAKYQALTSKDSNTLYFIEDIGRIYKGDKDVTSDASVVTSVPTSLASGKVQFVAVTTDKGTVYDVYVGNSTGSAVKALPGSINDATAFSTPATYGSYVPTVSAVKSFVETSIADVTTNANKAFIGASFSNTTGKLSFDPADTTLTDVEVLLNKVAHDVVWDADNLKLTIKQYDTDGDKTVTVNIPKDMFVQNGQYVTDGSSYGEEYAGPCIVLTINAVNGTTTEKKEVVIPVGSLVDTYTVGNTNTINLSMDSNHKITGTLVFGTGAANSDMLLAKTDSGLAATSKSIDGIMSDVDTKIADAKTNILGTGTADQIVTSTSTGIKRSGKTVGGATLATTPSATTVATEAAVSAAIDAALTWSTL